MRSSQAERQARECADRIARREPAPPPPVSIKLGELFDNYLGEVTPRKSPGKQAHDRRTAEMMTGFFGASRRAETLSRRDWDDFIEARARGGLRVAGRITGPVRHRQIEYDVKFMIAVLNWATGAKDEHGRPFLVTNPWAGSTRRSQGWRMPVEKNPARPSMTNDLRAGLLRHSPHWQFTLALTLERETLRRNSAIRQLRWADIDLVERLITWREDADKAGRSGVTPLSDGALRALRSVPRGIGESWVFPAPRNPSEPTARHTFQGWLKKAKRALIDAAPEVDRSRLRKRLERLGFHSEKRAGVRNEHFRRLPPKVQEALASTNYETLRKVYDEVPMDTLRDAVRSLSGASDRARERTVSGQ